MLDCLCRKTNGDNVRKAIFLISALFSVGLHANPVNCEEITKKIDEKTKSIAFEKIFEVERAKSVDGMMFVKSRKIPQYQNEISLFMQQSRDMGCPAYTGDITGAPYFKHAQKCIDSKLRDREACDKRNWENTP